MDGTDEPWWSVPIDDKVVAALILGPAFDDDLHTELRDFAEAFEISGMVRRLEWTHGRPELERVVLR
jgi:hypothetical protein